VSVITVKRAYEELEREGIIYRRQGLGTFVADHGHNRSREAKLNTAQELFREAAREAAEAGLKPAKFSNSPTKSSKENNMNNNAIEIRRLIKHYSTFKLGPLDLTRAVWRYLRPHRPKRRGQDHHHDLIFGMGKNDGGEIRVLGLDHRTNEVELKRRAAYVSPI